MPNHKIGSDWPLKKLDESIDEGLRAYGVKPAAMISAGILIGAGIMLTQGRVDMALGGIGVSGYFGAIALFNRNKD